MKQFLPSLDLGDSVEGRVAEVLTSGELIISFRGDLLRVANATHQVFQAGEVVRLIVVATRPLRFRLQDGSDRESRSPGRFDKLA